MIRKTTTPILLLLTLLTGLLLAPAAQAEPRPTSDLLLPYFEVDLTGFRLTTLFNVTNSADHPVEVELAVHSNWGIPMLRARIELGSEETRAFNLRDWLLLGRLPDGEELDAQRLAHLQAALSGQPSPADQLYYGSAVRPDVAVGYVTLRVQSSPREDSLWGNYYLIDPDGNAAQGDILVNIDRSNRCRDLCLTHRLFSVEGGVFDGGTDLVIWTSRRGQPSPSPEARDSIQALELRARNAAGEIVAQREAISLPGPGALIATSSMAVRELTLPQTAVNLELVILDGHQELETFIGVRYAAEGRYSAALQSFCEPVPTGGQVGVARIRVEKSTNGEDADQPTGPQIPVGAMVTWEYVITNTGNETLVNVSLEDDKLGAVTCPRSTLVAGASMTCTAEGIAEEGQYRNEAWARGFGVQSGTEVEDHDPSHYFGEKPHEPAYIDLEKHTNGEDADSPKGPEIPVGETVSWEYFVSNTGEVELVDITVLDDREGAIDCPKTTLAPGESMVCTATGIAQQGQYANEAWARGTTPEGNEVEDHDPSHYFGKPRDDEHPAIDLEKATNGHDADSPKGPEIPVGDPVEWTFVVTNTGDVELRDIDLLDDQEGTISCPKTTLAPGEAMTCTAHGTAQEGQYANEGWVRGTSPDGTEVEDHDPSHYFGVGGGGGFEGCTPGYWKNHTDSWPPTGYAPAQSVQSVFAQAAAYPAHGSASLLEALSFKGGPGVEGAVGNLLRAAVAGLLDASHPGVDYPRTPADVISSVDAALASGDRDTMLSLASSIDRDNNLGCPLN